MVQSVRHGVERRRKNCETFEKEFRVGQLSNTILAVLWLCTKMFNYLLECNGCMKSFCVSYNTCRFTEYVFILFCFMCIMTFKTEFGLQTMTQKYTNLLQSRPMQIMHFRDRNNDSWMQQWDPSLLFLARTKNSQCISSS